MQQDQCNTSHYMIRVMRPRTQANLAGNGAAPSLPPVLVHFLKNVQVGYLHRTIASTRPSKKPQEQSRQDAPLFHLGTPVAPVDT